MAPLTTLLTVPAQLAGYPQHGVEDQSCSCLDDSTEAGVRTVFLFGKVVDKTGKIAVVHREALPLSTTTNLN
jgi:hypothetical protein